MGSFFTASQGAKGKIKSQREHSDLMKLVENETCLVIAGSWNPAILTPPWVIKHGLAEALEAGSQVQTFLPAVPGFGFDFPRYVFPKFSYVARNDALILTPSTGDEEGLKFIESVAASILEILSHTPIAGIGHNFEFKDDAPLPAWLQSFSDSRQDISDVQDAGWETGPSVIVSSFVKTQGGVNSNITRQYNGSSLSIKFNYHHTIGSTELAIALLKGEGENKTIFHNFQAAEVLINKLYPRAE